MAVDGYEEIFLSTEQFLFRGASLRNTDWIIGCVVYTGHETKIMLNSTGSKAKFSRLET
jgi:magnesium-transporting ATPase (P-type)